MSLFLLTDISNCGGEQHRQCPHIKVILATKLSRGMKIMEKRAKSNKFMEKCGKYNNFAA